MKVELEEMKKQKVKMMRKVREDTNLRKITDARRERWVYQFHRDSRVNM